MFNWFAELLVIQEMTDTIILQVKPVPVALLQLLLSDNLCI
jgi:hypothetical protein